MKQPEQQHKLQICGSRLITTKVETISFQNQTIRVHEHMLRSMQRTPGRVSDKRLAIDVTAPRQELWRGQGQEMRDATACWRSTIVDMCPGHGGRRDDQDYEMKRGAEFDAKQPTEADGKTDQNRYNQLVSVLKVDGCLNDQRSSHET